MGEVANNTTCQFLTTFHKVNGSDFCAGIDSEFDLTSSRWHKAVLKEFEIKTYDEVVGEATDRQQQMRG